MKNSFIVILAIFFCSQVFAEIQTVNLNSVTYSQISDIPISETKKILIVDFVEGGGYFETIYDLLLIPGISPEDLHILKPYFHIDNNSVSSFDEKMKKNSYKIEQWLSSDGSQEGMSEVWLDQVFEPKDVNKMSYDDLMNLPNITPIDATAVLLQKDRGEIEGTFQLKNSPGISHYGYKNLLSFVSFPDEITSPVWRYRISSLIRTVPPTTNPDAEGSVSQVKNNSIPELFTKITAGYGQNYKFGIAYHRNMAEPDFYYDNVGFKFPKVKASASIENIETGLLNIDRIVLGNFSSSFGQGVVFENSDYFSPRRSGFGFSKRFAGIHQDLSKTNQYVMNGISAQVSNKSFRGILFASYAPRDAIINDDAESFTDLNDNGKWDVGEVFTDANENGVWDNASFSSLIVMNPRLPWGLTNGIAYNDSVLSHPLTSSVNEVTWGGHLRVSPIIGTFLGMSFYESLYDRVIDPQIKNTIVGGDPGYSGDDRYLAYLSNSADAEINAMYQNSGESQLWNSAKSFRRVIGFDFSTVIGNLALQGEYGELTNEKNIYKLGNEPHALVLNAYYQFNSLNLLALYRDYSLEFDNPYQRSFSNYQRYKTSIFEDTYWLDDPIFGNLYTANPQPQAERGLYLESRYQFHRSMVGKINWDTWTRVADNTRYFRVVTTIEFCPVFNYRIKVRQKFQGRGSMNISHPSPFDSRETRVTMRLRLSNFNQIKLLYSNNFTTFAPRPRLTNNAETESSYDMMVGNIGTPEETYGFSITHNFDKNFKIMGSIMYIEGFFWNFEDTDFRIFETETHALHNWVSFMARVSTNLSMRLKVSHTSHFPQTKITTTYPYNGEYGGSSTVITNPTVFSNETDFRLQVDYVY
ncbi:MAG: helix-hairpin-helix domain-containing protein [Candidatus Marinimicrobia bacterium]|nr:helix-hairpin-helix domain-containing protein [Candidatus Neomarinimicrobiota bacterium]